MTVTYLWDILWPTDMYSTIAKTIATAQRTPPVSEGRQLTEQLGRPSTSCQAQHDVLRCALQCSLVDSPTASPPEPEVPPAEGLVLSDGGGGLKCRAGGGNECPAAVS